MPFLVLPCVPQAREREGAATAQLEGVGLLRWLAFFGPLVKRRHWHKASPLFEGLTPGRSLGDRLGTGVDGRKPLDVLEIFREERNQTPARQDQLTLSRLPALPNDGLVSRRRYVVVRVRQRQIDWVWIRVEVLRELLLITSPNVPTAHQLSPAINLEDTVTRPSHIQVSRPRRTSHVCE